MDCPSAYGGGDWSRSSRQIEGNRTKQSHQSMPFAMPLDLQLYKLATSFSSIPRTFLLERSCDCAAQVSRNMVMVVVVRQWGFLAGNGLPEFDKERDRGY